MAKDCDGKTVCQRCKKDHLTIMHYDVRPASAPETLYKYAAPHMPDSSKKETRCSVMCGNKDNMLSCSKTILCELHHENRPAKIIRAYAVIDDQSKLNLHR